MSLLITPSTETRVNTTTASDQEFPTVAASFSTAAILRSNQAEKKSMTSAIRCLASERRHWPSVRASLGSFRRANKSGRSQNSNNYLRFRAEGSFNRSYFGGS